MLDELKRDRESVILELGTKRSGFRYREGVQVSQAYMEFEDSDETILRLGRTEEGDQFYFYMVDFQGLVEVQVSLYQAEAFGHFILREVALGKEGK